MNKEELQKELDFHQHRAGQLALRIREIEDELVTNKENLHKETGAVLILRGMIKDYKDVTPTQADKQP